MQILQLCNINVFYPRKGHVLSRTSPNTLFDQFDREKGR